MFHTRNFGYQLFHINKFINGKAIFSNWHRFSTIYDWQFSEIQSRNGTQLLFNIPCKNHQFCQRNQFCSGNDGIHPVPAENANSSNISLPDENPANNAIEQNEQSLEETEKLIDNHENLETRWLRLDKNNKKRLKLVLQKGKCGHKLLHFSLIKFEKYYDSPNIPLPNDAYAFVRGLDELIGEFATENFEQKLQVQVKSTMEDGHQPQHKLKLRNIEWTGLFHKFHLELLLFINYDRGGMMEKEICLGINGVNKITANERNMMLPLKALPWLRTQMARMLAKFDGTEEIANIPPKIPKKFFHLSPSQYPPPYQQQQQFYPAGQGPLPSSTDPAGQQQYYAGRGGPWPSPQQYFVGQNMQPLRLIADLLQLQARQQQRPQPPTGFPRQQQPQQYYVRSQQQQQMQKGQSQPPPTNPHYPQQQKSEMANGTENADQFAERSIEEICSEIGDGLTKMQKDLKELNEENGKMKKEIWELKAENEKLNEEMTNIWKEIDGKKNGTNERENVEERNSQE